MRKTRRGARRTVSLVAVGALALTLTTATAGAQTPPPPRDTSSACPPQPTSDFNDIAGSVHEANIRCLADLGIVQGKVDGRYDPRSGVRRDQMASFVVRFVEDRTGEELPGGDDDRFPDVPDANVHRAAINKLAASGWIQGRSGGRYDPEGIVTRGQMARFIAGAVSFLDDGDGTTPTAPPPTDERPFPDTAGSGFAADIARLAAVGIVTGFEDGTYRPNDPVLRDQTASFVARAYAYVVDEGIGVPGAPPEFTQTSRFVTEVDALQVVNEDGDLRQGEPGATGTFDLRFDAVNDLVCFDITLRGVTGDYASPAVTATHIHANEFGAIGPPVVAFPDPQPVDGSPGERRSTGCLDATEPSFDDGRDDDPGEGFRVADLEADPEAYYLDSHTAAFMGGAVRGQLGSTAVHDVALSWHDEVDDDAGLFGVGEPGATGDALLVVTDGSDATSGTAADRVCAALATDATGPFAGSPGAHIHEGDRDENGPVVVGFETPADDTGRSVSCAEEFLEGFTPADLVDDLEGYYVNLHSEDFPAGAVRGQLPVGTRIAADDVTSTWTVAADPDQVVGAGGEAGASASYELTFDSDAGVVCYEVTTDGVSGDYSSPAVTANHIHEAAAGVAGPPRVAFADPVPVDADDPDGVRVSSGCAVTPQFTGTTNDAGADNGLGATLADIEDDPADYYVDVHTEDFAPGAVRGQFADPFTVTSRVTVNADATQVVDGGEPGATGTWDLRMDRASDLICYVIELDGVTGDYASPALTATHIHEGAPLEAGPARVIFDDPQPVDPDAPDGSPRRSEGCVEVGTPAFPDGAMDPDPGLAASVADIEDDPIDYYVDTHTEAFPAGAVRGQFLPVDLPPASDDAATTPTSTVPTDVGASSTSSSASSTSVGTIREAPPGYVVGAFGCHFELA